MALSTPIDPVRWMTALILMYCLTLTTGCTAIKNHRELAEQLAIGPEAPVEREQSPEEAYRVTFPDVVELQTPGRPDCSGAFPTTPEGCLAIPALGNPRIEGKTVRGIARLIGDQCGLRPGEVRCRVLQYGSAFVYLHGPINGPERAVPYRGPESIVAMLRRVGGVTPGARLKEIHVVRSNVVQGKPPEVFDVDLEAILLRGDPTTNVVLQPFDTIYIGELTRARLGKALPEFLRPIYRGFCNHFPNVCPQDWRQQIREE